MTNGQIVYNAQLALADEGIIGRGPQYGVMQLEPIHTFATWKQMGFMVKRGEHAVATFKIWMYPTKTLKNENGEKEFVVDADGNNCFLKTSHFFALRQVERITR